MSVFRPRHAMPVIREYLEYFPGIVIEGARQVGKSTLARELAGPSALVLNLDDESVRDALVADPVGFIEQAGDRLVVIDEIQRIPGLTLAVKSAIDRDRRPGRFILTGSASLLRLRGTADSLAGRVARISLYGMSRGEALDVRDDFLPAALGDPESVAKVTSSYTRSDYAGILATGSYPDLLALPARIRPEWIESYLQGVVGRDLSELRREVNPGRTMSLLRTLAGRQSAELVKARLAADASIPVRTIVSYLDLLEDVGLIGRIPPWTPNLAKREIGRSKSLVLDSGVAAWLARLTAEQMTQIEYSEAFGAVLEGFVATELLRQRTWSSRRFELFHYRDSDGPEVDLIAEFDDGSVIAIEVKAAASFQAKDFKWLRQMRDQLGQKFVAGIVLNTGTEGYRYADRLFGAPVSALWELSAH